MLKDLPERITVIDALRGFALAGIAVVHMVLNYLSGIPVDEEMYGTHLAKVDFYISNVVDLFFIGKFFAIFSLLFGLSFYIQMKKGLSKNPDFKYRFFWRLFILFIIGFTHHIFYRGDILMLYAILGMFLVATYNIGNKGVLLLAVFMFSGIIRWVIFQITGEGLLFDNPLWQQTHNYFYTVKSGHILDVFKNNISNGIVTKINTQFGSNSRGYLTFGYFLLGMWLGRIGFFENFVKYKKTIVITAILSAILAGIIQVPILYLEYHDYSLSILNKGIVEKGLKNYYDFFMTNVVLGIFLLLYHSSYFKVILKTLVPFGRMALSMYLLQSLIGTFIFYGWGLGKLGEIRILYCFLIAITIIVLQVALCTIWLRFFKYGPLEWLWRSATYFKFQQIKK